MTAAARQRLAHWVATHGTVTGAIATAIGVSWIDTGVPDPEHLTARSWAEARAHLGY